MTYTLAPLAGFTNAPFRLLCAARGATQTFTEMVSAAGLVHGSIPTRHLLETMPGEINVVCQLFGARPDELAEATRFVSSLKNETGAPRFAGIDLNAGCPMPNIVKEGAGATLLRDPDLFHRCLTAMHGETSLPLTVKTRPGPSPDKVLLLELLDAAQSAGCSGMTMHGRFTSQMHGGPVHYDLIAELVGKSRIPITGNGGVYNRTTAAAMEQTGVSAIMIGRAAMANPWIFGDIESDLPDDALEAASRRFTLQNEAFADHLASIVAFHAQLTRTFHDDPLPSIDEIVANAARTQLFRYFNRRPGAATFRRSLNTIRTLKDVIAATAAIADKIPEAVVPATAEN